MTHRMSWLGVAVCAGPLACAHADVGAERDALEGWRVDPPPGPTSSGPPSTAEIEALQGKLSRFVAFALRRSPELRAAYARWTSAVEGAAASGRLPEPELSYGGFVRAVETRVGPQRHRVSLKQAFPWPGRLSAATDARSAAAAAEGDRFRARVLEVARNVAAAYWDLWRVERVHAIRLDHERVLEGLVSTVQARVETGEKTIAELLQVQLRLQALRDHRTRHRAEMRRHQARVLATIGADPGLTLRTTRTLPPVKLPAETMAALRQKVRQNPLVTRWTELESAGLAEARVARRRRLPSFMVGADYVVTGEARVDGVQDSGKDAIALSLGLSVPVWLEAYASEARAAESSAAAARAMRRGAWLQVLASLESTVARLRETHERIVRYERTLIAQAEALHDSVSAAYEVGRAGVSEVLLALEDELELRLDLASARAEHAIAWADLEGLTGRLLHRGAS